MAEMVVYCGWTRETEVETDVRDLGCGAGRIRCLECEGTGDWTPFHPAPETGPHPCVDCKGTGEQLIGV